MISWIEHTQKPKLLHMISCGSVLCIVICETLELITNTRLCKLHNIISFCLPCYFLGPEGIAIFREAQIEPEESSINVSSYHGISETDVEHEGEVPPESAKQQDQANAKPLKQARYGNLNSCNR